MGKTAREILLGLNQGKQVILVDANGNQCQIPGGGQTNTQQKTVLALADDSIKVDLATVASADCEEVFFQLKNDAAVAEVVRFGNAFVPGSQALSVDDVSTVFGANEPLMKDLAFPLGAQGNIKGVTRFNRLTGFAPVIISSVEIRGASNAAQANQNLFVQKCDYDDNRCKAKRYAPGCSPCFTGDNNDVKYFGVITVLDAFSWIDYTQNAGESLEYLISIAAKDSARNMVACA
jgi:hypothetical protein